MVLVRILERQCFSNFSAIFDRCWHIGSPICTQQSDPDSWCIEFMFLFLKYLNL
jgi:hypothetical protein